MAGDNANPFDAPLQSELGDHQQAQAATVAASPNGNPFDEPLASEKAEQKGLQEGEVTNDVGNTVIVPKEGESFADTMQRAAAHGKTVTQDQINKETATAPKKVAETLGAAAGIGAGGPALLGLGGEAATVIVNAAIDHLGSLDKIVKAAKTMGYASFGLKEAHDLYKQLTGDKK